MTDSIRWRARTLAVLAVLVAAFAPGGRAQEPGSTAERTRELSRRIHAEVERQRFADRRLDAIVAGFEGLVVDLRSNGLLEEGRADELVGLGRALGGVSDEHVALAIDHLRAARKQLLAPRTHLEKADGEIETIIRMLTELLRRVQALQAVETLQREIREILRAEEQVHAESKNLGKEAFEGTLDDERRVDDATTTQRQIARRVEALERPLGDALEGTTDPQEKARIEEARDLLEEQQVAAELDAAAGSISEEEFLGAVLGQKSALETLRDVERLIDPGADLRALTDTRDQLAAILAEQQDLRGLTESSRAEEFDAHRQDLQVEQHEIGQDLAEVDPSVVGSPSSDADPDADPNASASADPNASPNADPNASPNADPNASPSADPNASPNADPNASPNADPNASPNADPNASPNADPNASPNADPNASPNASPNADPNASPSADPNASPNASPSADPNASPSADPNTDPSASDASPPAGHPIERAAEAMAQAEQGIAQGEAASAADHQKQAESALRDAIDAIDQQLADAMEADAGLAETMADLASAIDAIGALEAAQGELRDTTESQAAQGESVESQSAPQSDLADATGDVASSMPLDSVSQPLGEAQQAMQQASSLLGSNEAAPATESQGQALDALADAREAAQSALDSLQASAEAAQQLAGAMAAAESLASQQQALQGQTQSAPASGLPQLSSPQSGLASQAQALADTPLVGDAFQQAADAMGGASESLGASDQGQALAQQSDAIAALQSAASQAAAALGMGQGQGTEPAQGMAQGQGQSPSQGMGQGQGQAPASSGPSVADTGSSLDPGEGERIFVKTAPAGAAVTKDRSTWSSLAGRRHAALSEKFVAELPIEYRAILEAYFKTLARGQR